MFTLAFMKLKKALSHRNYGIYTRRNIFNIIFSKIYDENATKLINELEHGSA